MFCEGKEAVSGAKRTGLVDAMTNWKLDSSADWQLIWVSLVNYFEQQEGI